MKKTTVTGASQRDKDIQRIILIEGTVNLLVLLAKLFVGLTTGSLAIVGDAIHSLTDVFNNVIAWIIIRLSSLPPDREHPYGHRKFETIAIFFLASILVVLAFELALHTMDKRDSGVINSSWGLGIMLLVLAVNISLAIWQRMWANRLKSDILMADASHTFADVLTTIVVIAGWQLSAMGYLWLDRLGALIVSAFILFLAYNLFKKALSILVDGFSLDPELLSLAVNKVSGVKQVNRIRSRWIGAEKTVDLIIAVDPDLSTKDSHNIASAVESLIEDQFDVSDISIHVEPFNKNIVHSHSDTNNSIGKVSN